MPIEMPIEPNVNYLKIDINNINDEIEEQVYKTYKKSRDKLDLRFQQVIDVDDVDEIDEAPGLGKIKISLGDEEYSEVAEMDYDINTKKVQVMHSRVKGNSWGETTEAIIDYRILPDGGEKLESRVKIINDEDGDLVTDMEIHYTMGNDGILTYENKSKLMDY